MVLRLTGQRAPLPVSKKVWPWLHVVQVHSIILTVGLPLVFSEEVTLASCLSVLIGLPVALMMSSRAEARCKIRLISHKLTQHLRPLIYGDMSATACNSDLTNGAVHPSDRRYCSFLSSNNLSPYTENSISPWTHCHATGRDCNNNNTNTLA